MSSGRSGELTFRLARPDDLERVAELEREAFSPPWSADDLALVLSAAEPLLLLAERGGELVGYALFQRVLGEAELLRIGVATSLRGGGLGARLLAEGLRLLAAAGDSACHLEVREGNVPARRLYARAGFRTEGRRRAYYGDGEDALLYRLDLPREAVDRG